MPSLYGQQGERRSATNKTNSFIATLLSPHCLYTGILYSQREQNIDGLFDLISAKFGEDIVFVT